MSRAVAFNAANKKIFDKFGWEEGDETIRTPQQIKLPFKVEQGFYCRVTGLLDGLEIIMIENKDLPFYHSMGVEMQYQSILSVNLVSTEQVCRVNKNGGMQNFMMQGC